MPDPKGRMLQQKFQITVDFFATLGKLQRQSPTIKKTILLFDDVRKVFA
jgi:hypothetical protein